MFRGPGTGCSHDKLWQYLLGCWKHREFDKASGSQVRLVGHVLFSLRDGMSIVCVQQEPGPLFTSSLIGYTY